MVAIQDGILIEVGDFFFRHILRVEASRLTCHLAQVVIPGTAKLISNMHL